MVAEMADVIVCWQGAVMTGLWVIAHECGHRAFCDDENVGDVVGLLLHSVSQPTLSQAGCAQGATFRLASCLQLWHTWSC
jgi:hypothetical protein